MCAASAYMIPEREGNCRIHCMRIKKMDANSLSPARVENPHGCAPILESGFAGQSLRIAVF
jgi:hypothetical protein